MVVLLTGCAGFIGMHVAEALLARGQAVLGIDSLDAYYDVRLKKARLARLDLHPEFRFAKLDIGVPEALAGALGGRPDWLEGIVHLAAQPGVRHSLERPFDYLHSNLAGHLAVLEYQRRLPDPVPLVYASSSSVYGASRRLPFSTDDPADRPVSLYAATKRSGELMSESYSRLYGLAQTGLRFFTVYGPWGRPDMAYWGLTEAIVRGRPITLFNDGHMRRDFTYIDDIIDGVLRALDRRPAPGGPLHRLYNLGGGNPIELADFVTLLERAIGRTAQRHYAPLQPGDVVETAADIALTTSELGWRPTTPLELGLARFVDWHRAHHATG